MYRISLLLMMTLLATGVYGQTSQFIFPLSIQDSTEAMDLVLFGFDPQATQCIDDSLGESEIPFDACCNWFNLLCIRFSDIYGPPASCLGNGVRLDLRAIRDSNQVDTFRVDFCGSPPFIIRWPSALGEYVDSARLKDRFNGIFYDIDMIVADSVIITNPAIKALMMYTYGHHHTTGIAPEIEILPERFSLSQNYPNPFNSTTTITYSLTRQSQVILKVIDLLGREVAVLVDGRQEPGMQSIQFDAGDFGSGVYICRLSVDGSQEIRKLLVQK
jgi:hypothetical protein